MEKDKRFSLRARIKSSTHAARGIAILLKNEHNFRLQIFFGVLALYLGFVLSISAVEWILIVFAIGFVLVTEALNSALEIDIDLTSPEYHPYARDTKDIAAGAVVLSVITALVVGAIVFLPKIFAGLNIN